MGLHKIVKIVALILGVAGMIFWVLLVAKGDEVVKSTGEGIDPLIYIAYITLAIVLLFVVIFVLKGIFAGNLKKTFLVIGAFLAIVIVSYMMSSGSVEGLPLIEGEPISESGSKWVSTGLNTFYILAIGAIGAMTLSGLKKITNK
jgi:Na+/proline symporter